MDLEIDIDIGSCRRSLGRLEDLSRDVARVYASLGDSVASCAPGWKGEDAAAFKQKMDGFSALLAGLLRDMEYTMDKMKNCLSRAERIESLWG